MSFPKQWCPSYWINSTQVAQKPHTHSSQPLSESLRYTVKLAKRLQTIMFHYNDISRNKEDYTLIKQWNYAGNHDDGCKFNNILYSWKVFFFFFFLLPERLEKLWARTEKRLCLNSRTFRDVTGMLRTSKHRLHSKLKCPSWF